MLSCKNASAPYTNSNPNSPGPWPHLARAVRLAHRREVCSCLEKPQGMQTYKINFLRQRGAKWHPSCQKSPMKIDGWRGENREGETATALQDFRQESFPFGTESRHSAWELQPFPCVHLAQYCVCQLTAAHQG